MFVIVLNDGETYTDLEGCKLLHVSSQAPLNDDEMDQAIKEVDPMWVEVVTEFTSVTQLR